MALERVPKKAGLLVVLACCLWLAAIAGAQAASGKTPGSLDPGFGNGGLVVQPWPPVTSSGTHGIDMAIGPEDEVFVLQSFWDCQGDDCRVEFFIQHYLADGALDKSFGIDGFSEKAAVTAPLRSVLSRRGSYGSLAVGPSGEPVLAAADRGDLALFRFDRSGRLARSFGNEGAVHADFGGWESRPQLALLDDEQIIVAGKSVRGQRSRDLVVLARFQPNGELDPSFAAKGPEKYGKGWTAFRGTPGALSLWGSGAIALAGPGCCTAKTQRSVYTTRRRRDGLLPQASHSRPWRYLKVGPHAWVSAVVPLPKGGLYLVGSSEQGMFAARLRPSGRLDKSFGRGGIVRFSKMDAATSPAVADANRRLYAAGVRYSQEEYVPSAGRLARLTPRGRHDRNWGGNQPGYVSLPETSEPLALGFQSDGRLVVFGEEPVECIRSCRQPGWTLLRVFTAEPGSR